MTIESYINTGNSFPIIVTHDERKYFVKLRAGMSGKYALINEWMGNRLGFEIGIRTQKPIWISLDRDIQSEGIHTEIKELVHKSLGLNIGFDFRPHAVEIRNTELAELDQDELKNIFLFDLAMLNIDRTPSNINLFTSEKQLYSVDYESSLLIPQILAEKNPLNNLRILQCLRNNPLYQELTTNEIDAFTAKSRNFSMDDILYEIPKDLLTEQETQLLSRKIKERQNTGWMLKPIMNELKKLEPETQSDQKRRNQKNQAEFKRKLSLNSALNN